jgi:hypothetical protein
MTTMSHDDIRSLLAPYALDAIDDDQRLLIADHLHECDECSFEVIELLDTTSVVALSAHEPAPEGLWSKISAGMAPVTWPAVVAPERVLDLTGELQPQDASAPSDTPVSPIEVIAAQVTPAGPAPVASLAEHRARGRAKRGVSARVVVTAFTSAAAAVLLVGPIVQSFNKSTPPTIRSLAVAAAEAKGTRTVDLISTADSVTRIGDVIVTPAGEGFIRIDDLPVLPDGKSYQLWTVVDGKPVSAGLLGTDPRVAAFAISANAKAVALSVEDEVGATQPSVGPIALAALA